MRGAAAALTQGAGRHRSTQGLMEEYGNASAQTGVADQDRQGIHGCSGEKGVRFIGIGAARESTRTIYPTLADGSNASRWHRSDLTRDTMDSVPATDIPLNSSGQRGKLRARQHQGRSIHFGPPFARMSAPLNIKIDGDEFAQVWGRLVSARSALCRGRSAPPASAGPVGEAQRSPLSDTPACASGA